jgi:recombination protein RecA
MGNEEKEKENSLVQIMKELNAKYGKGTVLKMSEENAIDIKSISTGCWSLDWIMGQGIPRGRIIEIFGTEGSGKSTLSMFLASQVQRQGGKAMLIDVEMAFDRAYAEKIGVNVDELLVSQPSCAEEALDIMDSMIRSNSVDLVILDSVASLVVRRELEGEIGDQDVALQARIMSKALRIMTGSISSSRTCAIFVNQIRDKIGGMYWGMKTQSAGGRALRFYSSIRLDVRGGKKIKKGEEIIGNQIIITAQKNKVANPFRSATLDLIFGVGIDVVGDLFNVAVKNKIISKSGNTFNFGDVVLKVGHDSSIAWLKENSEILEKIKQALNAKKEKVIMLDSKKDEEELEPLDK